MKNKIIEIIKRLSTENIPDERKEVLQPLIEYIKNKQHSRHKIRLNFICTHNSRRSHLSQIWAQTMAHYFNIENVVCFSGGTEATALFPTVAATLRQQGFEVTKLSETNNPFYAIKYDENEMPIIGFSKRHNDPFNPDANFCAVMTCASADIGCPYIAGADARIPIRYEDPKNYDDTLEMDEKYLQTSETIAREMYYVFSKSTREN